MHFLLNDAFLKYKNQLKFDDPKNIKECFQFFDLNNDEIIDENEFLNLLKKLYRDRNDKEFLTKEKITKFFKYYCNPENNLIRYKEFENFWNKTVRKTLFPKSALIIVDVQHDFIDGSLALINCSAREDGAEVISIINDLISTVQFDLIVYTMDWHPVDHISFYENLKLRKLSEKSKIKTNIKVDDIVVFEGNIEQKLWPAHCVQNSQGAALHSRLKIHENSSKTLIVKKGTNPNIDSYSAFFDNAKTNRTILHSELIKRGITDLYVCGVATDFCVGATASDGIDLNYRVVLIEDACRGVAKNSIQSVKRKLIDKGALIVTSDEVRAIVECIDRRVQMGYATILPENQTDNKNDNTFKY